MKINWPAKKSFCEAVKFGFEYVLLDPKRVPLHAPIQCKDFLTDVFWSEHVGKPVSIYGFSWKPGMLDPKAKTFMIACKYNDQSMSPYVGPVQKLLKTFEDELGYRPTSHAALDDSERIMVVTFPRAWTVKPIHVSAFSLLLRMGCTYDGSKLKDWLPGVAEGSIKMLAGCDVSYVKRALPRLLDMAKGNAAFKQAYSDYGPENTSMLHHSSGIVNWREKTA